MVRTATRSEWPAAARLLAAHLPRLFAPARADQVVRLLVTNEVDPQGLLVAESRGQLVGALLTQVTPGGVGSLVPPGGPHSAQLLTEALRRFATAGVRSAQCLVDRVETPVVEPLVQAGFRTPSDLLTLTRPGALPMPPVSGLVQLVPFANCDRAEVARVAELTFLDSPDFPELTALRPVSEWLTGQAAAFVAGGYLARLAGETVGLGIVEGSRAGQSAELHYMGLTPAARGRGLGHELLAHLLNTVTGAVVTAVDARNRPARRIYARANFRETATRSVYLWGGV